MVKPATENILSDGVLVAGMFNKDLTTFASFGNLFSLCFHQVSGFMVLLTVFPINIVLILLNPPQKHLLCKKGAPKKLQVPGTQCKKTRRKNSSAEVKSN